MKRIRLTFVTALLMLAPAATQVLAQTIAETPAGNDLSGKSLEALLDVPVDSVEGAARHIQRLTEAPASVSVITANDIETFGWRTLADVLKSVRGFHVTYDRNYSYVGVRAFGRPTDYNNRVLVMVNGRRLNDSIYDGAYIGTDFPLDLSAVERIEVVRGPGSALYGTSAFLAVINVITKRGNAASARQAGVEMGSFGTWNAHMSHGWSDNSGRDAFVSASRYDSHGPHALFFPEFAGEPGGGTVYDMDGDKSSKLFGSVRVGALQFQGAFAEREKRVPTASWQTNFGDPRFFTNDTRAWASVDYTRDLGGTTVQARGYSDHYRYYGDYPGTLVSFDSAVADAVGAEFSGRRRLGRHAVTVGVDQRTNLRQNQFNADAALTYVDDHRSSHEIAAYAQDEVTLTSKLTGIVGGRYDWWSLKGGTGRPRLGLVYRTENDTAIKALYGEAYRAPNLYELYYGSDQGDVAANATLGPEVVRTTELVVERHLGRRLRVSASAYHTHIEGLIDPVYLSDGRFTYMNSEFIHSRGVEFEGESRWPSGLLVRSSVAVQRARSETMGAPSNSPGQLGTLQFALPFWRRQLVMATDTTYVSSRLTVGGQPLPDYWLSNLTATYRPLRWPIVIGTTIYNVFDDDIDHPVGVEFRQAALRQDGRTAALRVTVKF
jgi:outer membrane receptor for ferrienterochelin and colicins